MGSFCEHMDPVSVLDYRYGTEEMRTIFRANSYLHALLEVEATLAEVQEQKNIILQLEVHLINIPVNIMESIYGLIKIQILKTAIALRKNFTTTMEIRMSLIFSLKLTII